MNDKIKVGGHINASINFAMQQNYVPIIRNILIANESEEVLKDLKLKITFEPGFAREYTLEIEDIEPGKAVEISPINIKLSTEFLFSLTEKMVGDIYIELYSGEEKIYEYEDTIELLAYDQWSGLLVMPEIISAFVTPNHPVIAGVLAKASKYLEKWGEVSSFTGYQTRNPNNVKLQMAAIYAALQSEKIKYNNPPASYEIMGQRIRLPHVVLEQKQGTCLDLSVLYATCLEAVGLFPLIVFIKGHAYAGCWLEEDTFADCAVDDVSAIEKRIVKGSEEILLVECTDYTASVDFEKALKHGKGHLDNPTVFDYVIDIQRSRGSGIRPIPVRIEQAYISENGSVSNTVKNAFDKIGKKEDNYAAPKELNIKQMEDLSTVEEEVTKQKVWERKLLDFSLRNALLNFRPTKNTLQLMVADMGQLEDKLADGNDFRVMEMPSEWTLSVRDVKMYEIENEKDLIQNIATEEFKSNRIRTFLNEVEVTGSLKSIYRAAKVSIEENGTNTLYLALGFLRWFESDLSEKPRYAPIVLLPIDIVKNNKNKGYIIRSRQEDAQINITLLEYLKQIYGIKINGLDPLPTDEHGIDLPLVYHTIRQAIMGQKRWNIENMAFIGLFSFGQFVMWNDIRNRADELKANKVVSSLMEGAMNWTPEEMKVTLDDLDAMLAPDEMAIPMSADSSQMVAIAAAASGQSFVLHGPPGTGKSQTITNMIANALYQGKSVLFVAEKMAALNVVQNRLASIGLDPFCLELHSNKTNKSSVLGQLNKALEVGRIKAPEEYKETADKIHSIRKNLNGVIEALHCKREYGSSLYEAIQIYEPCSDEKGNITFDNSQVENVSKEQIDTWNDVMREFVVALEEVGSYITHPLLGYEGTEYTMELRDEVETVLKDIVNSIEQVKKAIIELCNIVSIEGNVDSDLVRKLCDLSIISEDKSKVCKEMLLADTFDTSYEYIKSICNVGQEHKTLYNDISSKFNKQIFNYDVNNAWMKWKQASNSWFLPKLLGQNKLLKEFKIFANDASSITKDNIESYYNSCIHLKELEEQINNVPEHIKSYITDIYMGVNTDWEVLDRVACKSKKVYDIIKDVPLQKKNAYVDLITKANDDNVLGALDIVYGFAIKLKNIVETYRINFDVIGQSTTWIDSLGELFSRYIENLNSLKSWVVVQQKIKLLSENNLSNVVQAVKEGKVNYSNVQDSYQCNLYYGLILGTIRRDDRLSQFQGKQYEDIIAKYSELIEEFRILTIKEIVAKLSEQIPVIGSESAANSEVGILKKAIKSNGRMLSIRKLFNDIPTLLRKLCPCMLMSPISVAQYIDPSFPKFDLVIFDEASQLPTSEAVGTIARGENVVVVGDPKQLPPTSFFSSNRVDEDNMDKEDLESLLDDCLAISMPEEHLKWHYRSRHESLIAYSNMQYYENKLYTFPSPNDLVSEVKYVPIEGYYDKGRSKHNKAEARAVVDEIIRRLRDDNLKKDSIGVVTFSSVQQNLIDDMLSEEFVKYPELEEYDKSLKEPLFIKNLENVQGDERDIILFSIGYGPDKEGKVSMNFGPLNREGGWRRLNVAISRARKSMIVYSTLRPEQIDLSRTRSDGVAGLKGFLEFAARGNSALTVKSGTTKKLTDSLVVEIAEAIRNEGYEVKCNIGCSEYKMDIGIVNKDKPDTYLLGILLDGENCYKAATSKDRFVLQPNVLSSLGWNIMRVWTLEWLDNPDKVVQDIKTTLEQVIKQTLDERVESNVQNNVKKEEIVFEKMDVSEIVEAQSVRSEYATVKVEVIGNSDSFYMPESLAMIVSVIQNIIDVEAPISRKALIRKVIGGWGISRTGARVEATIDTALKHVKLYSTKDMENVFYWSNNQKPEEYEGYRVEDSDGNKRSMDDVVSYEIINAIKEVLVAQIGLIRTDLIRETAKKFGYTRLGSVIEVSIGNAIDSGVASGVLKVVEGEKIILG